MRPFVPGGARGRWTRALVADGARLAEWRARAGPSCRAVLPDYLALPAAEGLWTIRTGADVVCARLGPDDGFSAEPGLARAMLDRALEERAPEAVLAERPPEWLAGMLAARGIPLLADSAAAEARGFGPLQALSRGEMALDLRADPRAARAALRSRVLPWRWPLLAGALAAALLSAGELVRLRAVAAETARIEAETRAQVREVFVPAGPILDARVQVARALEARAGAIAAGVVAPDPVALLRRAAGTVAASGAVVEAVRYLPGDGLRVTLTLGDFAAAEALVDALGDAGLDAGLVEARVEEGGAGVRTEIAVEAGR